MIGKFTLRTRIGLLIFCVSLFSLISYTGIFYISHNFREEMMAPSPEQVASLVNLYEQTPASHWQLLNKASSSLLLNVSIMPPRELPSASEGELENAQALPDFANYQQALAGHPFVVIRKPSIQAINVLLQTFSPMPTQDPVSIYVTLNNGLQLDLQSRPPLVLTPKGLPMGFFAGLTGCLIAIFALATMHFELKPLSRLASAVEKLHPDTPVQLPQDKARSPEVQALNHAISTLQLRVQTMLKARMALLGGLQHDMRTFATRLRLRIEGISDDQERHLAEQDVKDIIELLDNALMTSRAGADELAQELFAPAPVIREQISKHPRFKAGLSLSINPLADTVLVLGDKLALRRILANLLENALSYGGRTHVTMSVSANTFLLTVDDDGPGIAPEHRQLLLEPFVRLETSRARSTGGSGLGLAIVRQLVEGHHGSVTIGESPKNGARVQVAIPVFNDC
ncbi:sensor histidine kinase [Gallaecimonas mangrovi]|uniref:sensor histidine kinase n=1 Tax=Gallaecimonas mangrovi TaxID=2291597 RepID=UPI000E20C70C|nr:ATP-binding protein [Gallaecimonas mangrovi]